ncbi:MAG: SDR family oxidoreductase [Acidiphilium sp.]
MTSTPRPAMTSTPRPAMTPTLLIAGLGYTGRAVAIAARDAGMRVIATVRTPKPAPEGVEPVTFDNAAPALAAATHLLVTAAPGDAGDPLLIRHGAALAAAKNLIWVGYCSTTGVYGDRGGGTVDEATPPAPGNDRTRRRVAAEAAWCRLAEGRAVDIIRLAGIYGPGRSAFGDLRAGTASRIDKPGHKFSRIHVEDIAHGVLAAIATARTGPRILNFADDEPAPSVDVVAHAASLLGIAPPPLILFAEAAAAMSPMARSFWAESRLVRNAATKAALSHAWRYPTYREGLAAILAQETVTAP